jgi:hypothetical protein
LSPLLLQSLSLLIPEFQKKLQKLLLAPFAASHSSSLLLLLSLSLSLSHFPLLSLYEFENKLPKLLLTPQAALTFVATSALALAPAAVAAYFFIKN